MQSYVIFEKKEDKLNFTTSRNYNGKSISNFITLLWNTNWETLYSSDNPCKTFYEIVIPYVNKAFPLEKKLHKKPKKFDNCFTSGMLKSRKIKSKLLKFTQSMPDPIALNYLKKYTKVYNKCLRKRKIISLNDKLTNAKSNIKLLWSITNEFTNRKLPKENKKIDQINYDGKILTSKNDISTEFNNFFASIGEKLAKKISFNKNENSFVKASSFFG